MRNVLRSPKAVIGMVLMASVALFGIFTMSDDDGGSVQANPVQTSAWEVVSEGRSEGVYILTFRMEVPEGWVVKDLDGAMIFVPDSSHSWAITPTQ